MTAETQNKLEGICAEICDNLCRWPGELKNQEKLTEKCDGCSVMVELANLVEELERKAPPKLGEAVYIIVNDCENCPYPEEEQCGECLMCKHYAVLEEHFNASEHLRDWYDGALYSSKAEAEAAVVLRKAESGEEPIAATAAADV